MKIVAIVPAAGIGQRFGTEKNKTFCSLRGRPLIAWSLQVFQDADRISEIIPVVKKSDVGATTALLGELNISKVRNVVIGGMQRQD